MADHRRPVLRALATIPLVLTLVACEPAGADRAAASDAASNPSGSIELATAEWVVREYFGALRERRTEEARALLAAGPRSDMDAQELIAAARELTDLEVTDLAVAEASTERIVFRSRLRVTPDPQYPGTWRPGVNTRWIEVVHSRRGWRIAEIASEPLPGSWSPVRVWTPVHVLEAEISVDVPHGWYRREGEWSWSPNPEGWPYVGLSRREAREAQVEEVPQSASVLRSAMVDLEWGNGLLHTWEAPGSVAGCGAETCFEHTLAVPDDFGRIYTFFARTARSDDLRPLLAVLRRMSRSAELSTGATLSARASSPECRGVTALSPGSAEGEVLTAQLRTLLSLDAAYEARRARPIVSRIARLQSWSLLEFTAGGDGQPSIAVLRERDGRRELMVVVRSITPQRDQATVRAELIEKLPDAPAALSRCAELAREDRQP